MGRLEVFSKERKIMNSQVTPEPYTNAGELEEILNECRALAGRLEACRPQTLLARTEMYLSQAAGDLEGVLAWAKRREAEQQATTPGGEL
jgi:hypothetical protein